MIGWIYLTGPQKMAVKKLDLGDMENEGATFFLSKETQNIHAQMKSALI